LQTLFLAAVLSVVIAVCGNEAGDSASAAVAEKKTDLNTAESGFYGGYGGGYGGYGGYGGGYRSYGYGYGVPYYGNSISKIKK
jgi:hypothetical protein